MRFTDSAADDIDEMGWAPSEALAEIRALDARDLLDVVAAHHDGGPIWNFNPGDLWIRLREERGVLVISFHDSVVP